MTPPMTSNTIAYLVASGAQARPQFHANITTSIAPIGKKRRNTNTIPSRPSHINKAMDVRLSSEVKMNSNNVNPSN